MGRCASAWFSIRRCALRGRIMNVFPGSPWPRTGDQWPLCPGVFRDCLGRCAPSPVCVTWGLGSEGGRSPGLPGSRCALTNFAVGVGGTARRHTAVSALGPGCVGDRLTSAASAGKGRARPQWTFFGNSVDCVCPLGGTLTPVLPPFLIPCAFLLVGPAHGPVRDTLPP